MTSRSKRKLLIPMMQQIKDSQQQKAKPSEQPLLMNSKNKGYITGYAPYPAEASNQVTGYDTILAVSYLLSLS